MFLITSYLESHIDTDEALVHLLHDIPPIPTPAFNYKIFLFLNF